MDDLKLGYSKEDSLLYHRTTCTVREKTRWKKTSHTWFLMFCYINKRLITAYAKLKILALNFSLCRTKVYFIYINFNKITLKIELMVFYSRAFNCIQPVFLRCSCHSDTSVTWLFSHV